MFVDVIVFTHTIIGITLLAGVCSRLYTSDDLGDVIHLFEEVKTAKHAGICCINFINLYLNHSLWLHETNNCTGVRCCRRISKLF